MEIPKPPPQAEWQPNSHRRRVRVVNWILRILLATAASTHIFVRSTVIGRENLAGPGRKVVASSHRSTFDPVPLFALITKYRRDVTFLAMAELFKVPVLRSVLKWFGIIPVNRGTQAAVQASEMGVIALEDDGVVAAYIEGRISTTGELLPAKKGVAYMAIRTGAPVIPVAVAGTQNVKRVDAPWWQWGWRQHYVIVIGEPIQPPTVDSSSHRNAFTDQIMQAIAQLKRQADSTLASQ